MIRTGRVVSKEGDRVLVCFERLEACQGCGACGGRKKDSLIAAYGEAGVGDAVDVEMPDAQIVKASFLMYLLPLGGFLAGLSGAGAAFPGRDLAGMLGGLAGMFLVWGCLKALDGKLSRKSPWQPRIVAVRNAPPPPKGAPEGPPAAAGALEPGATGEA